MRAADSPSDHPTALHDLHGGLVELLPRLRVPVHTVHTRARRYRAHHSFSEHARKRALLPLYSTSQLQAPHQEYHSVCRQVVQRVHHCMRCRMAAHHAALIRVRPHRRFRHRCKPMQTSPGVLRVGRHCEAVDLERATPRHRRISTMLRKRIDRRHLPQAAS